MVEEAVDEVDEGVEEGEEDLEEVDEAGLEVAEDLAVEEAVGDGDSSFLFVSEKRTNALLSSVVSSLCAW